MNILELLDELNVPHRRFGEAAKVTEGYVGLECPYCGHGPWYMGINLSSGWTTCWSCGPHRLADLIADVTGRKPADAKRLVAGLEHAYTPKRDEVRGRLVLPPRVGELLPAHRQYLAGRGFDPDEVAELWKVQGIGVGGRLQWRLFIPIHEAGEVVSWTTRAVGDKVPMEDRYRGAKRDEEVYPRKRLVYGLDKVMHAVVVCEGPTDVWRIGPGAVCTCGTGWSYGQVRRLSRFPLRVVCFDNEPSAQRRARSLSDQLAPFPGETYVVRLSGKDAASSSQEEIKELRRRFLD